MKLSPHGHSPTSKSQTTLERRDFHCDLTPVEGCVYHPMPNQGDTRLLLRAYSCGRSHKVPKSNFRVLHPRLLSLSIQTSMNIDYDPFKLERILGRRFFNFDSILSFIGYVDFDYVLGFEFDLIQL